MVASLRLPRFQTLRTMLSLSWVLVSILSLSLQGAVASPVELESRAEDPCVAIAGQKWVAPSAVRACFKSFKVDEAAKTNILDVIGKTLAFHASTNYQIQAPPPFHNDVHEDVIKSLARIRATRYASDYDLHIDLSRTLKRLNDGHCVWINRCYDSSFINYLPIPLVLLTEKDGSQTVRIAPEAFKVASAEFPDHIDFWQNSLKESLKGKLESLSGAKVLLINSRPPNVAVDANAKITGSYQGLGTRQNSFFSSYQRAASGWNYLMGNFAQQSLPLDDEVKLLVQREGHLIPEFVTIPYRARIGSAINAFTDGASFRAKNCVAVRATNGVDLNTESLSRLAPVEEVPLIEAQQQPPVPVEVQRKHLINVFMDGTPLSNVVLPEELQPLSPLNGSRNAAQFHMLPDGKTGVLVLGSFSDSSFDGLLNSLLNGLLNLKSLGATQLVVDVTNNGGGFICIAHYLHRLLIGPKDTTVPQAGLDTKARAGPLAQLIVKTIVERDGGVDDQLLYHPANWRNASNVVFGGKDNWLQPPVEVTINGNKDAFSQRLGQECQPESFTTPPPDKGLFPPDKIVIVSNGRCASSCSLFSITMSKHEGVKTVVVGGRRGVQQQYCGIVGGQSTDYSTIDTEIKTTGLKNHTLAPPDLVVNGVQGITWRLGFGIHNPEAGEEWEDHPADLNLPLTAQTVNNPVAIWEELTKRFF
ncbi:hypothetical protein HGRIS_011515 [Hohenbuehelia grisea]|uniref:Tail specific protease domain-containing protein n=1 Tax=Hohenbuehelia grisea TaxID=104357 RepID=A0ABR3JVA9_9AGAR